MKMVSCRDVGMDCDFVAKGQTESEIIRKCEEHAKAEHGMQHLSKDVEQRLKSKIHEEQPAGMR